MPENGRRPRLMVLDDWEHLIATSAGMADLRTMCEVTILDRPVSQVPDAELRDVRFLLAIRERTQLDAVTLARFPALELLVQTGGHAYHVDREELRRRGIVTALGRRARVVLQAMPELTFLLAIACLRRLEEVARQMATGEWPALTGRLLAGRRLGILGLGRHGRNVAHIGQAFGMDVVAWDRTGQAQDHPDPDGIARLPLADLLATSDVVTVHLRLSDESRGLLDRDRLRAMKPRSVLVNTARGAIVDENALVETLRDGPLAAAGLDVFTEEPLPAESPLRTLPNAVLTPHLGWTVEEVFAEFATIAAEQIRDYLAGVLHRDELLDPDVEPAPSGVGGVADSP